MRLLAEDFGTGQVLWSFLWFFLFFIWIWLAIIVFTDIFRSHDMGGFAKFLWVLFIVVLPYLGVFVYLIARGGKIHERMARDAQAADVATRDYIRSVASSGPADEIAKLADLKAKGVIDDAEFERLKAKVVASSNATTTPTTPTSA
jgi:putative oligomerization/nucleic acid binding protein/phospholipase D-like protein